MKKYAIAKIVTAALVASLVTYMGVDIANSQVPDLDWQSKADSMGVEIIWTSDERNCGSKGGSQKGGCFDPTTPEVIYVSVMPAMATLTVVFHELAHVQQYREGLPLDECDADRRAAEWGSTQAIYVCP